MTPIAFSRADDAQFGSFYYPLGLIDFTMSDPAWQIIRRWAAHKRPITVEGDEDQLVQYAYEITSLFHEFRHFADTFGTIAGINLFLGQLKQIKEFLAVSHSLKCRGISWRLPLEEWARSPECPNLVKNFIRQAIAFEIGADIYIAPFVPLEIDGHRDELLIEVDYQHNGKADAFPLRMGVTSNDDTVAPRTVLYPLGLETLMEGSAHSICRTFVESNFPQYVGERLQHKKYTIAKFNDQGESDQLAAQTALPYMVCELLITRFLRRHDVFSFPRDLVLKMIDRVLFRGTINFNESVKCAEVLTIRRVGRMIVQLLESEKVDALQAGTPSDESDRIRAYAYLLAEYEKVSGWENMNDDGSWMNSIAIWERYATKSYIVPLLRDRIETSNRAFTTYRGFFPMLQKIGITMPRVLNGELMMGEMPQRVQNAWWHHLMLLDIFRQLVRGGSEVFCPRANATVPGIKTANLAFEGNCKRHILLGCGSFRYGYETLIPNCLFKSMLSVCALEP